MDASSITNTALDLPGTGNNFTCNCPVCQRGREIDEIQELLRAAGRPDLADGLEVTHNLYLNNGSDKKAFEAWEDTRRKSGLGRLLLRVVDHLALRWA